MDSIPRKNYVGVAHSTAVYGIYAVELVIEAAVCGCGTCLPPEIGGAVAHIYPHMVVVRGNTQTAHKSTDGTVNTPDDIALAQHPAGEHILLCGELIVFYVVGIYKIVPAVIAALPALAGKAEVIEAVQHRHPFSRYGDIYSRCLRKAVGNGVPYEARAVQTAHILRAAPLGEVCAVAVFHLPEIAAGRCGVEPVVEGRTEIVVCSGISVKEVCPLGTGLVVVIAACHIECLTEIYAVFIVI